MARTLIRMDWKMFLLLVLFVICSSSVNSTPVFQQDGDVQIVCLFDIHVHMTDGACGGFDAEIMEMAYAASWRWNQMNSSVLPSSSIGFAIYDVCGSDTQAIDIISQYLLLEKQENRTILGGVISYMHKESTDVISEMLRHLDVPHILFSDDVMKQDGAIMDNSITLSLASKTRVEAAVDAMDALNWTYVSVFALNSSIAISEQKYFSRKLKQSGICQYSHQILPNKQLNSLQIPASITKGVIVFTGDVFSRSMLYDLQIDQENKVLIVGSLESSESTFNNNALLLLDHFTEIEGLSEFISNQQTILDISVNRPDMFMKSFQCNESNTPATQCILPALKSHRLHMTSDSIQTMFSSLETIITMGCIEHKKDCLPATLRELLNYHQVAGQSEGWKPYVELMSLSDEMRRKQSTININLSNLYGSVKVQGQLPTDVYNSHCTENCLACDVCSAKYSSSERIILQEADIFIVGSFPIYKSRPGLKCKIPNPSGLQAARAFLSAIGSFKTRYSDTISLQNITIGGAVFDSCSYSGTSASRISDVESCIFDYRDASQQVLNLPPSRTSAYFNFYENIDHLTRIDESPKLTASVSSLGLGLHQHHNGNYIKALTMVLLKVKWTYFKIIHSRNSALKQMVDNLLDNVAEEDLCIDDVIEIGPDVDDYLPKSTLVNKEGIGTLLFTTEEDTAKILDSIQSLNNSTPKQKLFIFPWNMQALIDIKRPGFLENALLLRPKQWLITSEVIDSIDDEVIPWISDFKSIKNITLGKESESTVVVGVDLILSTINAVYRDLCPDQTGICTAFSDYQNLRPRLETTFNMLLSGMESPFELHDLRMVNNKLDTVQIGQVEVDGNVILELSKQDNTQRTYIDILPSTCKIWCPKCYRCKKAKNSIQDLTYLPGDIILTGIFPIHEAGSSPFVCGELSDQVFSGQHAEAFMYALETAQTRHPYLLNNVRVGGMILDGCSNPHKAVQLIGNFETCDFSFDKSESLAPTPKTTLGYVVHGDNYTMDSVSNTVKDLGKLVVTTYKSTRNPAQISADSGVTQKNRVIVDLLVKLNWTHIYIITSDSAEYRASLDVFLGLASKRGVCVGKILALGTTVESIVEVSQYLNKGGTTAVVMMTNRFDIKLFFNSQDGNIPNRPWVVDISGDDWNFEDLTDVKLPLGTILLDKHGKRNPEFENFMNNFDITSARVSNWWKRHWEKKFGCRPPCNMDVVPNTYRPYSVDAARVIRSVDIALHAIHSQYLASCPLTRGLCANFVKSGIPRIPSRAEDVYFQESSERVEFDERGQLVQKYLIKTYSSNQQYEVGVWRDGILSLQGSYFQYVSASSCGSTCRCENKLEFTNITTETESSKTTGSLIYWNNSGVFNGEMWAMVLVAIAAAGAFISIILIVYVAHKVCNKTLARRYVGLGILLLIGVMLLFLSVVPFVFTPSETMCGLRFIMPGCTYAFSFAIIFVKLTSLRDYRLIGLGGEVSNLNQYLFVAFITAVQVGIGIQWWMLKTPLVSMGTRGANVVFACKFNQVDFVLHHAYVMILVILCSIYAINVRHETKNMCEARLLLWCCWLCVPVWIVWVVVFLVQDPEYSEPTACVAIVACATLMMTVIFIPKIHMVAKIKYNIAKGATSFQNGYKLENDFFYERPYSLPGTLTTNYSTTKTHPRSISNFDMSLSY